MKKIISLCFALCLAIPALAATQERHEGNGNTYGTTPAQKLAFHGATPVAQRANASQDNAGAAVGTLTFTAIPIAAETVTVGSKTYTFVATLTGTVNQVSLGVSETTAIANLTGAINGSTTGGQTPGITYSVGTLANTSATATVSGTTIVATATAAGTAGNSVATTETSTVASWGGSTLAGGTAAPTVTQLTVLVNELRAALVEKGLIKGSPP